MLKFWNTPYPFNDFVAMSYHTNSEHKVEIQYLRKKSEGVGIKNFVEKKLGNYLFFAAMQFPIGENQNIIFSGVAQNQGKFYFGQDDLIATTQNKISDSIGIYTMVLLDDSKVKITQDLTGCGTLFFTDLNGFTIVSNRYHLLLLFLSWNGIKKKIDPVKVASSLYSTKTVFLEANFTSQMDIKGVYQLPLHQEIIFDDKGFKIVNKESVLGAFSGYSQSEKAELLEQAKIEVVNNISAVLNSGNFKKVTTDLSGGHDSRAVFAAILNVEGAINNIQIITKDVPGSRDLEIAAGLKNLFGGKFYIEEGRSQYPVFLSESLSVWRSYFMGTYFRMGIPSWSPKGENRSLLRLSGGAGEIYRSLWSKNYGRLLENPNNDAELVDRLVNYLPFIVSGDYLSSIKTMIARELESLPGETPLEKLENYYVYFRNRYHYGMRAYEYYHDCPIWYPLLSESMFKISMSGFKERSSTKLQLELTQKLHPLLVWIDYDKKTAKDNDTLRELQTDPRFKDIQISLDSSLDEWKALQDRNRNALLSSRVQMQSNFNEEWRLSTDIIKNSVIETSKELMTSLPEFESMFGERFIDHLDKQNSTRYIYEMYARVHSIKDQIDIFEA